MLAPAARRPRRVVAGIGNRFRRDDRAGLAVVELLRERAPDDVRVLAIEGEPLELLDVFEHAELVLIADAVAATADPGSVYRFDVSDRRLPGEFFGSSTHAFGLADTIELARALGVLNARVLVYGIAGADFGSGQQLTAAVQAALRTAAEQMLADLAWGRDLFDRRPRPADR